MTQAELGAALGWGDKGANRLAQYETNYRVPRKDLEPKWLRFWMKSTGTTRTDYYGCI